MQNRSPRSSCQSTLDVGHFEVALDLDIDLIKMTFFDGHLAENFVRCFFRYYPRLSTYVKEVFLDLYRESTMLAIKETSQN